LKKIAHKEHSFMNLELAKNYAAQQSSTKSSTLVVFAHPGQTPKSAGATKKSAEVQKPSAKISVPNLPAAIQEALEDKSISGKSGEALAFRGVHFGGYKNVVVVGLGSKRDPESFRQLAATVLSSAQSLKTESLAIQWDSINAGKKDLAAVTQAFAEGLLLSDYSFDELKSKKKDEDKKEISITLVSQSASDVALKKAFFEARTLAESVNFSRRLGDLPGNLMTPTILANTISEAAKGTGVKVEVWDRARIKKEKMGGLFGVAEGSEEEPRFIILRYEGAAKSKAPIVYVGKGLTFDSGGISIKPSAAMEEMKYDMCGGANVLGAVLAIAKLKLKVNAIGLVPSTENMPCRRATKPGDVHTSRNGKTFEINNTDAEGRLILSDALAFGSEQKPALMVDAATLTGAMVVALGNTHTGYFTKNEALSKKIEAAAQRSGEWVWRMPLCDHHTKDMKGTFADLSNISSSKGAGSATAAAFLEQFVEEGIPWAHFDIAGTGWAVGGRLPYCSRRGASGVMVRTFVELARLSQ
jgi:leucyl aminopeptidase